MWNDIIFVHVVHIILSFFFFNSVCIVGVVVLIFVVVAVVGFYFGCCWFVLVFVFVRSSGVGLNAIFFGHGRRNIFYQRN